MTETATLADVVELQRLAIEQLRAEVLRVARQSRATAMLACADPALVLPTPAVGRLRVDVSSRWRPTPEIAFRSTRALTADGEVWLAPLDRSFEALPYEVESCAWRDDTPAESARTVSGLILTVVRRLGAPPTHGWLTCWIDEDPVLQWVFTRSQAFVDGQPVATQPVSQFLDLAEGGRALGPLEHRVIDMDRGCLRVEIPAEVATKERFQLDLRFRDEHRVPPRTSAPVVVANVLAVWNALPARYPAFSSAAQAVSEAKSRYIHPLSCDDLGRVWRAWRVDRVGAAGNRDLVFASARQADDPFSDSNTPPKYHLAFWPATPTPTTVAEQKAPAAVAIVLDSAARRLLDHHHERLAVDYWATTGARGNGLPVGSEFQMFDQHQPFTSSWVTGTLLTTTWGGEDGLTEQLTDEDPEGVARALLAVSRFRTLGDVVWLFKHRLGSELSLVDQRDLLYPKRRGPLGPLLIRVRFQHAGRTVGEKRTILRATGAFLEQYLRGSGLPGIRLVEE